MHTHAHATVNRSLCEWKRFLCEWRRTRSITSFGLKSSSVNGSAVRNGRFMICLNIAIRDAVRSWSNHFSHSRTNCTHSILFFFCAEIEWKKTKFTKHVPRPQNWPEHPNNKFQFDRIEELKKWKKLFDSVQHETVQFSIAWRTQLKL